MQIVTERNSDAFIISEFDLFSRSTALNRARHVNFKIYSGQVKVRIRYT